MFDDIGKKIKTLATVSCVVCSISYVITAFIMFANGDDDLIGLGFLCLLAGPLLSWVGSFFIYGFGELIDKACEIERNTRSKNTTSPTPAANSYTPKPIVNQKPSYLLTKLANEKSKNDFWICKKCGTKNALNGICCKDCGTYK